MREPARLPPPQTVVSIDGFPGLYLDNGLWNGVPVMASTLVPDGQVLMLGAPTKQVVIGVRPLTELERARYRAKWLVQNGLRDVLTWLGERVTPEEPVTGAEIMTAIRAKII